MSKRLQGLVAGVLIGVILTSGVVFAKQLRTTAELFYDNIKISLDGKEVHPQDANGSYVEPFTIDGTTYLPVRAVANALGINVDWDGNSNTVLLSTSAPNKPTYNQAEGYNGSSVATNIEVVKEYTWKTQYSSYAALILKNVSQSTLEPRVQISFKNANGDIIGAANKSENAFGPGNEMIFVFNNRESFDSYEYVVSSSQDRYYSDCVSNLETKVSTVGNKAIVQITNKGTEPAKFVYYTILFKNGNSVVDYGYGYCVDSDNEIKPNMTEIREDEVYGKTFDSVEVYIKGRRYR